MTRNNERAKQILLTKTPGMASQGLDSLTPETIVAKANIALDLIKSTHNDAPKDIKFMGAKQFLKGDILLDLNSAEAATWLRTPKIKTEFMQGFGAMSDIKDREYSCVVENVPISFEPSTNSLSSVERQNDLSAKSILLGRWIKPKEKRFEGQRTAFMIIAFRTAEDANKAILNSIYVAGKRCIVRKLLAEPRRCFKCHVIGARHVAATCKEIAERCDICGGVHPSNTCSLRNEHPSKQFCINCNTRGHPTRDRLCPTYLHHTKTLNERMPENLYKYFPTDDPASWELTGPTSQHQDPTPQSDNAEGWTAVHSRRKAFSFTLADVQQKHGADKRTKSATGTNKTPLGTRQTQLDDAGFTNASRPGPSQQYKLPSQRQRAEVARSQKDAQQEATAPPEPAPADTTNSLGAPGDEGDITTYTPLTDAPPTNMPNA
jgi:hypothetical protein